MTQSGNPTEEAEIVRQLPDEPKQRKSVARWPAFRRAGQFRRTRFKFLFEEPSHTVAHFCR